MMKYIKSVMIFAMIKFLWILPAIAATIEPSLNIPKNAGKSAQVALTLDLCMGDTDHRIFDELIKDNIKTTLFVTARWLKRNGDIVAKIRTHPELFEVANHGKNHVPAIDNQPTIYGLKTAGNLKAVCEEIEGGQQALIEAGFARSPWYRDASARYSPDAIHLIKTMGYKIAGFSLNADMGASLSEKTVASRIEKAKDGDVIIAHMNQPKRQSGAGVVEGVRSLKNKGFVFLKLSETILPQEQIKQKVNCNDFLQENSGL